MKTWTQQNEEIWAREREVAERKGFASVQAYRDYLANENRKRTYLAKIARYQRAIEEMQTWLDEH